MSLTDQWQRGMGGRRGVDTDEGEVSEPDTDTPAALRGAGRRRRRRINTYVNVPTRDDTDTGD